jgi:hypothetical protein
MCLSNRFFLILRMLCTCVRIQLLKRKIRNDCYTRKKASRQMKRSKWYYTYNKNLINKINASKST